jgi:hypothetical protein
MSSNQAIINTTLDFMEVDDPSNLKYIGTYTYNQSKDKLNTIDEILKQILGKKYLLIILLSVVNLIILILLIASLL